MENLKEIQLRTKERKKVTQSLLDQLDEIDNFVTKICEEMNDYPKLIEKYKVSTRSSRIGSWTSLMITRRLDGGEWMESVAIPQTIQKIGSGLYLHGDFQAHMRFANRSEVLQLAKDIPELLKALNDYINAKVDEETQLTKKLAEIVKQL